MRLDIKLAAWVAFSLLDKNRFERAPIYIYATFIQFETNNALSESTGHFQ